MEDMENKLMRRKRCRMECRKGDLWKIFPILVLYLLTSCERANEPAPRPVEPSSNPEWAVLKEFTQDDLREMERGLGLSRFSIIGAMPRYPGKVQVRAVKMTFSSAHPGGGAARIRLSGLLLLPPTIDSARIHSQLLALPYTYVLNRQTPTQQIADYVPARLEAYMLFGILQASRGYVVLMPDYPGFGESFGQCAMPYVERRPMVHATIDFIRASQQVLQAMHYGRKRELTITGYSLGAYVATQTAREMETNASAVSELTIDRLWVGGTPCDLKRIADEAKVATHLPTPYLLPLAIHSYRRNGYPKIAVDRLLRSPYAEQLTSRFDGMNEAYADGLPTRASDLFTEAFVRGDADVSAPIDAILSENSLTPWRNRCAFVMLHGASDRTVYLDNARAYAEHHQASGGQVDFRVVPGNHKEAGILYYLYVILHLPEDRNT